MTESEKIQEIKAKAYDEVCNILAEGGGDINPTTAVEFILSLIHNVDCTVDGLYVGEV